MFNWVPSLSVVVVQLLWYVHSSVEHKRSAMFEMQGGVRPECVFKRLAYMCFLQERRQWKKGYFIVLIFKSFDKKIKKASEKSYGRSFSLSLFRSLSLSLSLIHFHLGFPLQHAPLSFLSLVRRTSHLFPLSRHCCFQKTQFLFITLHRVAALGGGHRRRHSRHRQLSAHHHLSPATLWHVINSGHYCS